MEPKLDSFDSLEEIEKIIPSPENKISSNNYFFVENQTKLGVVDKEIDSFQNISTIKKNHENSFIQINKEKIKNMFNKNKTKIPNKKIEIAKKINNEKNFITKKFTHLISLNINNYKIKNKLLNDNKEYNLFFGNKINLNINSLREKYAKIKENAKNNSISMKKLKNVNSENNLSSVKKYLEEKYKGYDLFQNRQRTKNDNDIFHSILNFQDLITRNNNKNDIPNNINNINENKYIISSMRTSLNKKKIINFDLCLNNHSYCISNNEKNFSYKNNINNKENNFSYRNNISNNNNNLLSRNNLYFPNKINNYSKITKITKNTKKDSLFGEMEVNQRNNKISKLKLKIPKSTNYDNNNEIKNLKINLNNIRNISNDTVEYKTKTENLQKNYNFKKIIRQNSFNYRNKNDFYSQDFGKIITLNKNLHCSNNNINFNNKNFLFKKIKISSSQYDIRNNRRTPFYYYNYSMNNSRNNENPSINITNSNQISINNLLSSKKFF